MIRTLARTAEDDLVSDLLIQQIADADILNAYTSGLSGRVTVFPRAWFEISDRTQKTLRKHYRDTFRKAALAVAGQAGTKLDAVELNRIADQWAISKAFEISRGVTTTLQSRVENAVSELDPKTVGITGGFEVRQILSKDRAELIGATETTRAAAAGEGWFVDQFNPAVDAAEKLVPVWITAADERTCYICAPLHNTLPLDLEKYGVAEGTPVRGTISGWDALYGDGPPAHPRCRCSLRWVPVGNLIPRRSGKLKQPAASQQATPQPASKPRMGRLRNT